MLGGERPEFGSRAVSGIATGVYRIWTPFFLFGGLGVMGAWIGGHLFMTSFFFWLWTSLPFFLVQYGRTERWLVGRHRVVVIGLSGGGEGGD